jgi:hypothetical protein
VLDLNELVCFPLTKLKESVLELDFRFHYKKICSFVQCRIYLEEELVVNKGLDRAFIIIEIKVGVNEAYIELKGAEKGVDLSRRLTVCACTTE